jgi:hypothetical protein
MYCQGALENVRLAKIVYPGWTCRFVIPKKESVLTGRGDSGTRIATIPERVLSQLDALGAEIVRSDSNSWNLMLARFYAIEDYHVVLVRDTDSRLTFREAAAVSQWLHSSKGIHAMRDHPWHGALILGGMWGFKRGVIDDIRERCNTYLAGNPNNFWQVDQLFLREVVWRNLHPTIMTHASFCRFTGTELDFPSPRVNGQYVGQAFDEDNRSTVSLECKMKRPEHKEEEDPQFTYFDRDEDRLEFVIDGT